MPTPEEVRLLIAEAERGKRPEMARAILVAATTGLRRAELCALRRTRDLDLERGVLRVSASVVKMPGEPVQEIPTKNRRTARAAHRSWSEIGAMLGVSKQAAQRKYASHTAA